MTHKTKADLVLALLKIVVWLLANYFVFLDVTFLIENLGTGFDDSDFKIFVYVKPIDLKPGREAVLWEGIFVKPNSLADLFIFYNIVDVILKMI